MTELYVERLVDYDNGIVYEKASLADVVEWLNIELKNRCIEKITSYANGENQCIDELIKNIEKI